MPLRYSSMLHIRRKFRRSRNFRVGNVALWVSKTNQTYTAVIFLTQSHLSNLPGRGVQHFLRERPAPLSHPPQQASPRANQHSARSHDGSIGLGGSRIARSPFERVLTVIRELFQGECMRTSDRRKRGAGERGSGREQRERERGPSSRARPRVQSCAFTCRRVDTCMRSRVHKDDERENEGRRRDREG